MVDVLQKYHIRSMKEQDTPAEGHEGGWDRQKYANNGLDKGLVGAVPAEDTRTRKMMAVASAGRLGFPWAVPSFGCWAKHPDVAFVDNPCCSNHHFEIAAVQHDSLGGLVARAVVGCNRMSQVPSERQKSCIERK